MKSVSPAPDSPRTFRFRAFLLAELLGVLNDNALRVAIQAHVILNVEAADDRGWGLAAAGLLFALPFILISWVAGWLSDRYPKHRVILILKLVEIAVCLFVLFSVRNGGVSLIWIGLGLMALQSALFSPSKYGILPEVLQERFLSYGNGLVNLTTFVAMAGGAALGILVAGISDASAAQAGLLFVALAAAGAVAAAFVPRSAAAQPDLPFELNPLRRHREDWTFIRKHPSLPVAVLGVAVFYFLAALFQLSLLLDLQVRFDLTSAGTAALIGALTIGLGAGSYLAGRWSDEKIELGLVPLGAILITVFCLFLAAIPAEPVLAAILLLGVGAGGGFFVIPLVCLIQQKSPMHAKGRVIALSNVFNFTAIALASLVVGALAATDMLPPQSWILGIGLLAALATAAALSRLPLFFVRFTVWLLAHTVYRIEILGRENIPHRGPALLIPNHVSWVDAIVIQSTLQRFIRFMMFRPFYEFWPTHWFFREAHVIPVAKGDPPEKTEASLQQAADELAQGHLVLIFAEGKLTRTGDLSPFRQGYRRILEKLPEGADIPIIPVGLSGLWGSVFSHEGGKFLWKWPRRIPYDVSVRYGKPLPVDTPPEVLQEAVQELIGAP